MMSSIEKPIPKTIKVINCLDTWNYIVEMENIKTGTEMDDDLVWELLPEDHLDQLVIYRLDQHTDGRASILTNGLIKYCNISPDETVVLYMGDNYDYRMDHKEDNSPDQKDEVNEIYEEMKTETVTAESVK